MKHLLLLHACVVVFSSVWSQTYKGQLLVGGSLGFERYRLYAAPLSDRLYTTLSLAPDIGYFVITNLALGLRPEFSYHRAKLENVFQSYTISLAPFARVYVLPPSRQLNVLADASVFGLVTRSKGDQSSSKNKFYGYSVMAGPVFFVNHRIGLEFTVGYWSEFDARYRMEQSNEIRTRLGLQVHL